MDEINLDGHMIEHEEMEDRVFVNEDMIRGTEHVIEAGIGSLPEKRRVEVKKLTDFLNGKPVVLVGGVALRLMESLLGQTDEVIVNDGDIDVIYLGTDQKKRQKVQKELNEQTLFNKKVSVGRFFLEDEPSKNVFPQMMMKKNGEMAITALKGLVEVSFPKEHLETIKFSFDDGAVVQVASPALMFHLYATRSMGVGKRRDWSKNKFNRVRRLTRLLQERKEGVLSPNDLTEWRDLRNKVKKLPVAKLINMGVDVHDWIGRPLEKLGASNLIY